MNEFKYFLKLCRNAVILGSLYFLSIWASTQELCFETHLKPIIIFTVGYVGTELTIRYKLKDPTDRGFTTLIL